MSRRRATMLSSVDTAWLRMKHPTNLMMITGVLIFDEPVPFERFKATIEHRLVARFERFRQRVITPALGVPRWESDPAFDMHGHVHRIALPAPGDHAALEELVSDFMSMPLDFSKSPWQFHLVEGYGAGSVLLARLHHCIADGVALIHVLLSMTDATPDAPWPQPPDAPARARASLLKGFNGAIAAAQTTLNTMRALRKPEQIVAAATLGASGVAALGKLGLMSPDPKTVFKGQLGIRKRASWSQPIALHDAKAVGRAMNATLNDVLLAALTGALRRYLEQRGQPVDGLNIRAAVPVNLRPLTDEPELGNHFGLVFLALPVGVEDVVERLAELKRRMDAIKDTPEAVVAYGILATIGRLPDAAQEQVVRLFGTKATGVMTNVPGPRETLYFAGKPIRQVMFWVPQSGRLGLGVSILSYAGSVLLGIVTDAGLAPDPEAIVDGFHTEFAYMLNLARLVED